MSVGVNHVHLVGHLGADPEVRHTASGQSVASFRLATTESWTDKQGEKQARTEWHRIVAWDKLAELCRQYLRKGRLAYVEGTLRTRSWEKDGQQRFVTEIIAREVTFLGPNPAGSTERVEAPIDADDVPLADAPEAP